MNNSNVSIKRLKLRYDFDFQIRKIKTKIEKNFFLFYIIVAFNNSINVNIEITSNEICYEFCVNNSLITLKNLSFQNYNKLRQIKRKSTKKQSFSSTLCTNVVMTIYTSTYSLNWLWTIMFIFVF